MNIINNFNYIYLIIIKITTTISLYYVLYIEVLCIFNINFKINMNS